MIPRARIVRAGEGAASASGGSERRQSFRPGAAQWRRIAREELAARLAAERIVQEAHTRADDILCDARERATAAAAQATQEAREAAVARALAQWLALRQEEQRRLGRDQDRIIAIAVTLAERLLGAALDLHPDRIVALARVAIAEARGARAIAIEAHPLETEVLRRILEVASFDMSGLEVRDNESLARGELRLQTDMGIIDAKLAPRLERLAAAILDTLA